jgi:hypothetical protein
VCTRARTKAHRPISRICSHSQTQGWRAYCILNLQRDKQRTEATCSQGQVPKFWFIKSTRIYWIWAAPSALRREKERHIKAAAAGCVHPGANNKLLWVGGGYVRDLKDVHCWQLSPAGAYWVLITRRMFSVKRLLLFGIELNRESAIISDGWTLLLNLDKKNIYVLRSRAVWWLYMCAVCLPRVK